MFENLEISPFFLIFTASEIQSVKVEMIRQDFTSYLIVRKGEMFEYFFAQQPYAEIKDLKCILIGLKNIKNYEA